MILMLQNKNTGQKVVVANTHLYWSPQVDFLKYGQSLFLKEKCAEYLRREEAENGKLPFILPGDFNSKPNSSSVNTILGEDI